MLTDDPYNLQRFVDVQKRDYAQALQELGQGRKRSHWIWYIFPQVAGLGSSSMAREYAIKSREEAVAYLNHELLGPRLLECSHALLRHRGQDIGDIMGWPDDLKLKSSMTLFASVDDGGCPVFHEVLQTFYAGERDEKTLAFLDAD